MVLSKKGSAVFWISIVIVLVVIGVVAYILFSDRSGSSNKILDSNIQGDSSESITEIPSLNIGPCSDSDSGNNYYSKGIVENINVTLIMKDSPDARIFSNKKASIYVDDGSSTWKDVELGKIFNLGFGRGIVTNITYFGQEDSRNSVEVVYLTLSDYCYNSQILVEYSCNDKKEETYECAKGCVDGACTN